MLAQIAESWNHSMNYYWTESHKGCNIETWDISRADGSPSPGA